MGSFDCFDTMLRDGPTASSSHVREVEAATSIDPQISRSTLSFHFRPDLLVLATHPFSGR